MLETWLEQAASAAGIEEADRALLGDATVRVVLDLARDAAHAVERPAAPLAAFALGLALGRRGAGAADVAAAAERVARAAASWEPPLSSGP